MVSLLALKLAAELWKRTFSLSKKLRPRTWVVLAVLNACVGVISFWSYRAKQVSDSAIPPVHVAEVRPIPFSALTDMEKADTVYFMSSSMKIRNISYSGSALSSHSFILGFAFNTSDHVFVLVRADPFGWKLPPVPSLDRTVVQASPIEPDLLSPVEKVVALLVAIVTTFLSLLNTFLAWQIYRRAKSQEILTQLQIASLRYEIARLNEQDERARREAEKTGLIFLP